MISAILVTKPLERPTIEAIREFAWSKQINNSPKISKSSQNFAAETANVELIRGFGFAQDDIKEYLSSGKPGPIKACHFLLQDHFSSLPATKRDLEIDTLFKSLEPNSAADLIIYSLQSPTSPSKIRLLDRIRNDRLQGYESPVALDKFSPAIAKSYPPSSVTFAIESSATNLKNSLHDACKSLNVTCNPSLACTWVPTSSPFDLSSPTVEAIDQLVDTLRCQENSPIEFNVTIVQSQIVFKLTGEIDDWTSTKFQYIVEAIVFEIKSNSA